MMFPMPSSIRDRAGVLRPWAWLLLGLLLNAGQCCAQNIVLHLCNGDRISGLVLSESTNSVVLATPFSDRVTIDSSLIQRREVLPGKADQPAKSPSAPHPPAAPASGIASELILTNKPSMAQAAGGAAKSPAAGSKAPEPSMFRRFLAEWRGEAQLGLNLGFSTKDREAFTSHMKFTHNHTFPNERSMRNILDYDVLYGTADNVLSDNRMEGTWKTEYDLTPRFLFYNASGAGYDEVLGTDLKYDFGPGLGYKWIVLTNFVFKNEIGADYQKQYFVHDKESTRYSLRLAEDLWWQITPKIKLDEKVEFFPSVQDVADYRIRMEANLSYLLKQNLTLTLNVVDLYDTALPPGVTRNDLQIRSLLGIKF
jgi:hypothetical protein